MALDLTPRSYRPATPRYADPYLPENPRNRACCPLRANQRLSRPRSTLTQFQRLRP